MITIQVFDSISCSSHKNGTGKNVLIFAKKLTNDLKLQRLKVLPLATFFRYSLTLIIKGINKLLTKNSPHPIWKTDTLLPSWNHLRPQAPKSPCISLLVVVAVLGGSSYHL